MSAAATAMPPSGAADPIIVKDRAEQLLKRANVWGRIPVPLNRVAEIMGYICMEFDNRGGSLESIAGAIDYRKRTIWVSQFETALSKRFTIAHEIGHAALHPDLDVVDYRSTIERPTDRKEIEANKFAHEILMPEDFFRLAWQRCRGNLDAVGVAFEVTPDAVGYRAQNLGLV